jgi:hypothetical protein
MLTDTTISSLIAKLGCLDPVPGIGGGDTGYRPLDEGEVAAATLVACGDAVIPELIQATKSDHWEVRYRCADVLGILGSEADLPALVGLLSDANRRVQQSAMLALLGDSGMDLAASGHVAAPSAFMEYCRRSSRFDILRLLVRHGTAEIRTHADTLLNQQGSPARRTVLHATLSYAEKKRNLVALKVDVNWVCDQIRRTGTEPERASAAQFLQHWINDSQNVRAASPPPTPAGQLVIPAAYSPLSRPSGSCCARWTKRSRSRALFPSSPPHRNRVGDSGYHLLSMRCRLAFRERPGLPHRNLLLPWKFLLLPWKRMRRGRWRDDGCLQLQAWRWC